MTHETAGHLMQALVRCVSMVGVFADIADVADDDRVAFGAPEPDHHLAVQRPSGTGQFIHLRRAPDLYFPYRVDCRHVSRMPDCSSCSLPYAARLTPSLKAGTCA